jgi:hypothetical protein
MDQTRVTKRLHHRKAWNSGRMLVRLTITCTPSLIHVRYSTTLEALESYVGLTTEK